MVVSRQKVAQNARIQLADRRRLSATRLPEKRKDQLELVGKEEKNENSIKKTNQPY